MHIRGIDPQRGAMLGMSLLLGARGIGAVLGPLFSARWAGHSDRRLRLGILFGYLTIGAGYFGLGISPNVWVACLCIVLAHCGGSTVWVFSTTLLAVQYGRPLPRTRLLRRPRLFHADHRDWRLRLRSFSRSGSFGPSGGVRHRPHHDFSGAAVGVGDEDRKAKGSSHELVGTVGACPERSRGPVHGRATLGRVLFVESPSRIR